MTEWEFLSVALSLILAGGRELKPQIPWLRVFVEGVVIVGGRLSG